MNLVSMQESIDMLIRYLKKHQKNIESITVDYPIMFKDWEIGEFYPTSDKTRKIITIELKNLKSEK